MRQRWSDLFFLHWRVDPSVVAARIPTGLHVDTHDGDAWIGIVPFRMERVRPRGLPAAPWISSFLELNVRTYVFDGEGTPGVWFWSLDCSRLPAVAFARTVFHLPYHWARMRQRRAPDGSVRYSCRRRSEPDESRFVYRADPSPPTEAAPGSLEFFLLERYHLFASPGGDRGLRIGTVAHRPYRFRSCTVDAWDRLPADWDRLPLPDRPPDHRCVTETVDVDIHPLRSVGR